MSANGTENGGANMTRRKPTVKMSVDEPRPSQSENATNTTSSPRLGIVRSMTTSLARTMSENFKPEKQLGREPTVRESLRAIATFSYLNLLLVCIPVSWALHFALSGTDSHETIVFIFAFLAIMPLAALLSYATDQLSMRVGQTLAGLMNATLGNAVELIVSIIALLKCELQVVQSSLMGSILSNLLLVLGMCFFAGGIRFSEQGFGISPVQLNASLLTVSVIALLLPAAFHFLIDSSSDNSTEAHWILSVSHGSAICLLAIYVLYLVFQLGSHKSLYDTKHISVPQTVKYDNKPGDSTKQAINRFWKHSHLPGSTQEKILETQSPRPLSPVDGTSSQTALERTTESSHEHDPESQLTRPATVEEKEEEEAEEHPEINIPVTIGLLVAVTVLVAVTAEFLVDSINGLVDGGKINKEFVSLILLPIVGNAAEHVTAVTSSYKDKLTLSLGVAVGSSIQIALFVIPFITVLAWIIGKPLTLLFDPLESISVFFAVLVVNYTTQDGKSNWLEGSILMILYIILAVMFWFYPGLDVSANQLGLQC